jgi:flagellar hook-associated protein 2
MEIYRIFWTEPKMFTGKEACFMILPVYNYFAATYAPNLQSANRTHKPSELRSVYSSMVKVNQKLPLYKFNLSTDTQVFALSLKAASMELNQLATDMNTAFTYEKAVSENPEAAKATILENKDGNTTLPDAFSLEVHSLASTQVNTGTYVPAVMLSQAPASGSYSFVIEEDSASYEFQFHIKENSKNQDILTKLSDFINKSKVGVQASVLKKDDSVALRLESEDTGDVGEPVFRIYDTSSPDEMRGLASFYQLDNITKRATNASYAIDGEEHTGLTNRFILNRSLQVDLLSPSEGALSIDYGPDTDRILSRLQQFRDSYNYTLQLAKNFGAKQPTANRVVSELTGVMQSYLTELESAGFSFNRDGSMEIDTALATQAISENSMDGLFSTESGPIHDLINKTNYIKINPMDYVDKVIVTYPNLSKPAVGFPYASSIYSGLLFNYYC